MKGVEIISDAMKDIMDDMILTVKRELAVKSIRKGRMSLSDIADEFALSLIEVEQLAADLKL